MKKLGMIVYGAVFCIAVPVLVVLGCRSLDPVTTLTVPPLPAWVGWSLTGAGAAAVIAGMLALAIRGGGLPMNGFPPIQLVTGGIYSLLPHPIYCGAVMLCGGISLIFASASGLYIFTPLTGLGCAAIVWGFERPDLFHRFGRCGGITALGTPPMNDDPIRFPRRASSGLFPLLAAWHFVTTLPLAAVHIAVFALLLCQKTNRTAGALQLKWLAASLLTILCELTFSIEYALWFAVGFNLLLLLFGSNLLMASYMAAEWISNSFRAWRMGHFRIINHSIYSFLAAAAGFYLAGALTGGGSLRALCVVVLFSLLGGAFWAQLIEGSNNLLRPFGFYGAVFGAILGLLAARWFTPAGQLWVLFGALATAGPWIQSIGRLRCMVQGCCHGKPIMSPGFHKYGIRHVNPSSRVCRFTDFSGVPVHATALYSIALNLVIGWLLAAMWIHHAPAGMLVGLYFSLTGFARFVEEAWRGEPQTRRFLRLTEYQWLCIGFEFIAFAIWAMPSSMISLPTPVWHYSYDIAALAAGALYAFAMSMDFPESGRRFSRLTG
ncbi:MAG: prolipoprotein diacylglyceryl transferase family protein [Victivallaceae bacterium]|nr:prolipoprotein diacylglyceryl transferase family protein [Victivallaceae bacterium]